MSLSTRCLPFCFLLLAATPRAQDDRAEKPADKKVVSAPIVISYGTEGLRLTANLIQGLLNGSVGRRLRTSSRETNPDWPPLRLSVQQGPDDQQQPTGYFTCSLEVQGLAPDSDQGERLLRAAAEALGEELSARLYDGPKDRVEARLKPAREEFEQLDNTVRELQLSLQRLGDGDSSMEDHLRELRSQLMERDMTHQVDDPLVEVEQKQAADVETRLRDLAAERAKCENQAVDIETRLEALNNQVQENQAADRLRADLVALRSRLLQAQAAREQVGRESEMLAQRQNSLSQSLQDRVQRLQESRIRAVSLRAQIDESEKRLSDTRKVADERMQLERKIAALEMQRDSLRPRLEALQNERDRLAPVRVDLWR